MTGAQRRYLALPERNKQTLAVLFEADPRIGDTSICPVTGIKYSVRLEPLCLVLRVEVPASKELATTHTKKYVHTVPALLGSVATPDADGWSVADVLAALRWDSLQKRDPAFDVNVTLSLLTSRCEAHIRDGNR